MASTEDLEVARILRMLPHLVWEAQHPPPCTHGLRWGSRKRRSAGHVEACPVLARSPAASPSPRASQLHHPAAPASDASSAKTASMAAMAESSSPGTPLEFFPSSEESKPAVKRRRRGERRSNGKKPKSDGGELAERLQLLIQERTELQKEVAEARGRLEAERWRYSEPVELRTKLEERRHPRLVQPHQQLLCGRSPFDPAPPGALRPIPRDHGHAAQQGPEWQAYQPLWRPNQWMSAFPVLCRLPTTGFALCLPPSLDRPNAAAAAEANHGEWTASRPLGLGGGQTGARPCMIIPDLNAGADEQQSWG